MTLRARDTVHRFGRDDVTIMSRETVFRGYFRVDRYLLCHRLFGGAWSRPLTREVFERGHAVAVLPYDPVRDSVVLIEQFRVGPLAAGDGPWLLEVIAGIIEEGEVPEDVARRETREETDLNIGALEPIADCYASPGGTSERVRVFCALADVRGAGGIHGNAAEGEDIRVAVMGFEAALAALEDGRVRASPAVVGLQWLALNRTRLRTAWRTGADLPRQPAPR